MKANKSGNRNIHVRDKELIHYLESKSKENHVPMFEIAQELMHKGLSGATSSETQYVSLKLCEYDGFVKTLLNNGYRVDITPTAGATGLNERVLIKFRKEK